MKGYGPAGTSVDGGLPAEKEPVYVVVHYFTCPFTVTGKPCGCACGFKLICCTYEAQFKCECNVNAKKDNG